MATSDDRVEAIIRARLAGKPSPVPELTRAERPEGDVASQRAVEARAADLADLMRLLADECGTGDILRNWADGQGDDADA